MNSITEIMPYLLDYQPALFALVVLSLTLPIQSFLTAPLAFVKHEQAPGMPLNGDHSMLSFRVLRAYSNSAENLPAFGFALLVAIFIGVDSSLVNWTAAVHVAFRLAFWVVYYSGIGKVGGGPRTLCYVGGMLANMVLAIAAMIAFLK